MDEQTEKAERVLLTAEQKQEKRKLYSIGYWDGVRGVRTVFGDGPAAKEMEALYEKGHAAGRKALEDGKVAWTPKRAPKPKAGREVLDYAIKDSTPPSVAETVMADAESDAGVTEIDTEEDGMVAVNGVRADDEAQQRVLEAEAVG